MDVDPATIRRVCQRTTAGFAAGSVAAAAWAVWPIDRTSIDAPARSSERSTLKPSAVPQPEWESILLRNFQAASYAPIEREVAAPAPPPAPQSVPARSDADAPPRSVAASLGIELVGTVLEPGRNVAIVVDGTGSLRLIREGQTATGFGGDLRVGSIQSDRMTLIDQDETLVLTLAGAAAPGAGAAVPGAGAAAPSPQFAPPLSAPDTPPEDPAAQQADARPTGEEPFAPWRLPPGMTPEEEMDLLNGGIDEGR